MIVDRAGRHVVVELSDTELIVLRNLATQLQDIVGDETDAASIRLFPDAYPDDADAADEFRRYTRRGLVTTKEENAAATVAELSGEPRIELALDTVDRWLRVLTDLRLVIAERIGIERDDDPVPDDQTGAVYHWLGALQELLVRALEED